MLRATRRDCILVSPAHTVAYFSLSASYPAPSIAKAYAMPYTFHPNKMYRMPTHFGPYTSVMRYRPQFKSQPHEIQDSVQGRLSPEICELIYSGHYTKVKSIAKRNIVMIA